MTLVSLAIPDDVADWPGWLERQLIGIHLSDLVDELKIIAPSEEPTPDLDELIGDRWDDVFQRGLSSLDHERIRPLIRHPELLVVLQERVFVEGGKYWQELPVDEEVQAAAQRVAARVAAVSASDGDADSEASLQRAVKGRWNAQRTLLSLAALAACLLVALGIWALFARQSPDTFAWETPATADPNLHPPAYATYLADSLNDWWFRQHPETEEELSNRLRRFRHGCETLIAARHPQLSAEQREQLVTKCKKWLGKLDKHLADLNADADSVSNVRQSADETVRATVTALRQLFS